MTALEAALKIGDAESLAATVQSVAEDLEIKLEHCTKSGGRLGGSVIVRVRTLQGSDGEQELAGVLHAESLRSGHQRQPRSVSSVEQSDRRSARPGQIRHVGAGSGNRAARRTDRRQGWRGKEGAAPGSSRSRRTAAMTNGARLLGRHRRMWLAVAAVLLAAIAAALAPPPAALADAEAGGRWTFAALASAAIVALAILPFIVWRSAARPQIWVAVAVAALALGVGSFSAGGYAQRACTARYADKPVIIGTDLTPLGAAYKQANPELSSDDLLFDAAGVPERIWTPAFDRPLQSVHQQHLFPVDSVPRRLPAGNRSGRADRDAGSGSLGRARAASAEIGTCRRVTTSS